MGQIDRKAEEMECSYRIENGRAVIDKILDPGQSVAVPGELDGYPVTELGAYALADSDVEELYLPARLVKIGAYAFYNCKNLRRITCYGRTMDLGTGLFAGVQTVEYLDITLLCGERSCLKELLSELRQTLRVRIQEVESDAGRNPAEGSAIGAARGNPAEGSAIGAARGDPAEGGIPESARMNPTKEGDYAAGAETFMGKNQDAGDISHARLIFPEYYEDSVENTPARIVSIETHGCGHRYRYCFQNRVFQYKDYDAIFPHMKVQEPEALAAELAFCRLRYPLGLTETCAGEYRAYLAEHWQTAGRILIQADRPRCDHATNLDPGQLPWLVEQVLEPEAPDRVLTEMLPSYITMAQKLGDTEMVSWMMDYKYKRGKNIVPDQFRPSTLPAPRPRRFEL